MESEVSRSASEKGMTGFCFSITGGRQQHTLSVRDRHIWLKVSNGECI